MILLDLLINFFYHFIYLLGIFILASFLVGLCEKYFYRLFGGKGRAVCIALGCVGTPLHESGHALMCLLFGHKIRKIVFFQPNSDDGCLGYVEHGYNNRNPYQVIGCFFIAIGPVLLGTAVLTGLLFLLCRSCFYDLTDIVGSLSHGSDLSFAYTWRYYWDILSGVFRALFSADNFTNVGWWVFLVLGLSIAPHMGLSSADVKNGVTGLIACVVLLFVADLVLILLPSGALDAMNAGTLFLSGWMFCFLCISLLYSLALLAVTFVVTRIMRAVHR